MTRHLSILGLIVCAGAANAQLSITGAATGGSNPAGNPRINEYVVDDGTGEDAVGAGATNIFFGNRFIVNAGQERITNLRICWGTQTTGPNINGHAVTVGVWADGNAVTHTPGALLSVLNGVVANASATAPLNNIFNSFDIPDVTVGAAGTSFLIGFIFNNELAGQFPVGFDTTAPSAFRSFTGFGAAALDPNNLAAGMSTYGEISALAPSLVGDWLIRADAIAIPAPGATALFGLAGLAGLRRRR